MASFAAGRAWRKEEGGPVLAAGFAGFALPYLGEAYLGSLRCGEQDFCLFGFIYRHSGFVLQIHLSKKVTLTGSMDVGN